MKTCANSKFVKLPDGYSCKITQGAYKTKSGYHHYSVTIVKPNGEEFIVTGDPASTIAFAPEPEKAYSIKDLRNALVREHLRDEIAYHYYLYGYGERTKKYLDACKSNIGLIGYSSDENLSVDDSWDLYAPGAINSSNIYIKQKDSCWTAAFQIGWIDTFIEYRYMFNKKPSVDNIWGAHLIQDVELAFSLDKYCEWYTCTDCNNKVEHWLDVKGSLEEKWHKLEEKYCGC